MTDNSMYRQGLGFLISDGFDFWHGTFYLEHNVTTLDQSWIHNQRKRESSRYREILTRGV